MKNINIVRCKILFLIFLLLFVLIFMLVSSNSAHAENNDHPSIEIYKSDGSLQCEKNSGTSVVIMKNELEEQGVNVLESRAAHDGMSYMSMCGAPTGKINIYKIRNVDQEIAEKVGFIIISDDVFSVYNF
jgi:hypothetical protein